MSLHGWASTTATNSHMNADGSNSPSRNLVWAGPFHRLQSGTTLHVNNVCLLLNQEGAGWGLSNAKTNWAPILKTRIPGLWRFMLQWVFCTDLYRFDKKRWKISIMHWAQLCKYCMEFSCFIFRPVKRLCCSAMLVFGKAPVFNILQQSVLLFWGT